MARLGTSGGKYPTLVRIGFARQQCRPNALRDADKPLRLARLAPRYEDQIPLPLHMLPPHTEYFCRPHSGIEHDQQHVAKRLPAIIDRLRSVLAGWRARNL